MFKIFNSMFTRLYLGIVAGLGLTVMVFLHLGEEYMHRTDVEIFLNDASFFVNQYIEERGQPNSLYKELERTGKQRFYIFDMALLKDWDESKPCANCEFMFYMKGLPVYLINGCHFAVVMPIPNSSSSLFFSEHGEFFEPQFEWYENSEIHFVLALLATLVVSLGALIYMPVRRIQKQINLLVSAQRKFGQGCLTTRTTERYSHPIRELADGFNSMAEDIESRVRQSQIFTQAIPHEIRTPLSRIQMASDLARIQTPIQDRAIFNNIDTYVDDIKELSTKIVQLSKLNLAGSIDKASKNSDIYISDFCSDRLNKITECQGEYVVNCKTGNTVLNADETLCQLVIDNFITNATRYGKEKVRLSLTCFKTHWAIDIEDDGPGIPLDKRKEIFMAFSRLDRSRNADSGGFGLGLAIAASAAKTLNWTISVDDSELGGARFTVLVPLEVKPQQKKVDIQTYQFDTTTL
ncbi:ATP-binding protein [Vibrio penaeicida]|uniref:histidine kinase n=1 Tax=Vibrio penaeicida TaxID=104609 RepID=A0AAV5P0U0_9VIBR|nr:ATP-binding protein [Vibrio penaeicida]RTZ24163.1 two-component sensor histidine kinase [Vibrio penaeicida]GLQ76420.1 hypothetical protein GCM10007932_57830 [Vibrio penaeicida]